MAGLAADAHDPFAVLPALKHRSFSQAEGLLIGSLLFLGFLAIGAIVFLGNGSGSFPVEGAGCDVLEGDTFRCCHGLLPKQMRQSTVRRRYLYVL